MLSKNWWENRGNLALFAALAAIFAFGGSPAIAAPCESLASLSLPNVKITLAETVAAGGFKRPGTGSGDAGGASASTLFDGLPTFCRVAATLTPSSDSDIKIEVWLPASGWNGNFQAVGNGGWAGVIRLATRWRWLWQADTRQSARTPGTRGTVQSYLPTNIPRKMIDFAYRSEHEMTVTAKAILAAFYGRSAELSYWNGCSTGGRQALSEAQRYPSDYNGIVAGAPGNNRTHLYAWSVSVAQAAHKDETSYIPPSKYAMIHKAVLDACDGLDGLKDGLITDPTRCHFDPKVLACKGADSPSCLTAAQVETAQKIYSPAKNPRTGQEIYTGLEPGSELGWAVHAGPEPMAFATDGFRYVTFKNPAWDYRTL